MILVAFFAITLTTVMVRPGFQLRRVWRLTLCSWLDSVPHPRCGGFRLRVHKVVDSSSPLPQPPSSGQRTQQLPLAFGPICQPGGRRYLISRLGAVVLLCPCSP